MIKPLGRRLIVFQVSEVKKRSNSGLYLGNSKRGSLSRVQDLWVITHSEKCKHKWQKGDHYLVSDGMELEPYDLKLWEDLQLDPAFQELREVVRATEGRVETKLVSEASLLAEVKLDPGELFSFQEWTGKDREWAGTDSDKEFFRDRASTVNTT